MVGISCICLTYGRVSFLEEALNSFLKQDYPEDKCELIIINDYGEQKLVYDHPNVRILNFKDQFPTIGDKVNFAIQQSQFDVIATWDDDDIALSHHLKNINQVFGDGVNLLHWAKGCFWNEPDISSIGWLGNSGIVYSRDAINEIKGVPLENAGYDTTMVDRIHTLGMNKTIFASPEQPSWFYRWGFISKPCYHQSGQGTDNETRPNILVRHAEHIEQLRVQGKIPTGEVKLNPHWVYDYEQQLKDFKWHTQSKHPL